MARLRLVLVVVGLSWERRPNDAAEKAAVGGIFGVSILR
jgi:hypothetical protein